MNSTNTRNLRNIFFNITVKLIKFKFVIALKTQCNLEFQELFELYFIAQSARSLKIFWMRFRSEG